MDQWLVAAAAKGWRYDDALETDFSCSVASGQDYDSLDLWSEEAAAGLCTAAKTNQNGSNFRVGEQMGEQKPQKAKRPHKMGPFSTNMAEAMGFELMDLLQSTVFKTVALNHSATPPFALRAP